MYSSWVGRRILSSHGRRNDDVYKSNAKELRTVHLIMNTAVTINTGHNSNIILSYSRETALQGALVLSESGTLEP